MDITCAWYVLLLAFVLDLVVGDPPLWPHPVRWMGSAIERCEFLFRLLPMRPVFAGALMAVFLIAATWGLMVLLLFYAHLAHPALKTVLEIALLFYCISARSLKTAALDVLKSLKANQLEAARDKVALIVGRDTHRLNKDGIARAVVETVAENLVDGIITPLFFALIGGVPLAMAYKMINTLDSMIGYKSDRYLHFGKTAARIDDVANFIPARLSIFVIAMGARITGSKSLRAIRIALREGARHTSPNAGYPEAAFAGALGVRLNGPNYYHGQLVDKPFIGAAFGNVTLRHIKQACDLMTTSAAVWLAVVTVASGFWWGL